MYYNFVCKLFWLFFFIVNGNAHYEQKEKLPKDTNYILVGPHRTVWDPMYFALATRPKKFTTMAKEELFKNPILGFILRRGNVFPVKRNNPGLSAIKGPVQTLKNTDLSLMMFPSGTRHSEDLKGGAALIAKMAKVPLVPAVYQGPLRFTDLLKRRKVTIRFGDPIDISDIPKINKEGIDEVERRMSEAFKKIDIEIDPTFIYGPIAKK